MVSPSLLFLEDDAYTLYSAMRKWKEMIYISVALSFNVDNSVFPFFLL